MERAIVVKGHLTDPKHIELDEPVTELQGPVEVVVRRTVKTAPVPFYQGSSREAWEAAFDAWVEGHDCLFARCGQSPVPILCGSI